VFVGVGIAVFGWLPHQTAAAWITFAASVVIGILGDLLDLPNAATSWSPFEMLAAVPAEDFEAMPALALLVVAAVLVSAGVWRFANRDLEP
jgi:putative exporter of polyketide antibiotics